MFSVSPTPYAIFVTISVPAKSKDPQQAPPSTTGRAVTRHCGGLPQCGSLLLAAVSNAAGARCVGAVETVCTVFAQAAHRR